MADIDLGCGPDKKPGIIGADINKHQGVDIVCDLNKFPYPFKDEIFNFVCMSHTLEHLDDTLQVLNEIHRITKPKGRVIIKVPHFSARSAYYSIEHKHFFALDIFEYIKIFRLINESLHYSSTNRPPNSRERLWTRIANKIFNYLASLSPKYCERIWCYWVGGFEEIEWVLEKE